MPNRVEDGVAPDTIAVMQSSDNKKTPTEIWVMYSNPKKVGNLSSSNAISQRFSRKIVISAWRFPGVSPVGKQIPIPADILEELKKNGIMS